MNRVRPKDMCRTRFILLAFHKTTPFCKPATMHCFISLYVNIHDDEENHCFYRKSICHML